MTGRLKINGYDAYETWRMVADDSAISALMTPSSLKTLVSAESRLEDGKRYVNKNNKQSERSISMTFSIQGNSREQFFARYAAFCEVLYNGTLDIETSYQSGVVYHCLYQKCSQFTEYNGRAGKFVLTLVEPDPTNRA